MSFETGSEYVGQPFAFWLNDTSKQQPTSYVFWREGNSTAISDFPKNPEKPRTWRVSGQLRVFDGRYAVSVSDHRTVWLTVISTDGQSKEYCVFQGGSSGFFGTGTSYRLSKSNCLLLSIRQGFLDSDVGQRTLVIPMANPLEDLFVLESSEEKARVGIASVEPGFRPLGQYSTFRLSDRSNWLLELSEGQRFLWDVREEFSSQTPKRVDGLQSAVTPRSLVANRYAIFKDKSNRFYSLDLCASDQPSPREFFSFKKADDVEGPYVTLLSCDTDTRFCAINRSSKEVLIWDTQKF
jgi:hypothetical protein